MEDKTEKSERPCKESTFKMKQEIVPKNRYVYKIHLYKFNMRIFYLNVSVCSYCNCTQQNHCLANEIVT